MIPGVFTFENNFEFTVHISFCNSMDFGLFLNICVVSLLTWFTCIFVQIGHYMHNKDWIAKLSLLVSLFGVHE
jgi:hypothetical protein